jgi:hypothetical protein
MTLTFKVSPETGLALKAAAARKRISTSKYVRDLVENRLRREKPTKSLYDLMMEAGAIGCISSGKGDLSTNPKYMEGYGQDNHRRRAARRAA